MQWRSWRDVSVPFLGLGCWQIGAGWGHVEDDQARAILRAAYDGGTRLFDTAEVYGDGLSERRIGQFIADLPNGQAPMRRPARSAGARQRRAPRARRRRRE